MGRRAEDCVQDQIQNKGSREHRILHGVNATWLNQRVVLGKLHAMGTVVEWPAVEAATCKQWGRWFLQFAIHTLPTSRGVWLQLERQTPCLRV